MSFLTEINSLQNQLQISNNLNDTSVVINEYSLIYDALGGMGQSKYLALDNAITRFKVLKVSEIISDYDQVISLLQKANNTFIEFNNSWSKKKHQCRQDDNVLNDCVRHIDSLINQLDELNNKCWQDWIKSLEEMRYIDPIVLKSLKNIPNMSDIYASFIRLIGEIRVSSKVIPTDLTTIQVIKQKNDQLIVLKNQMSFDFDQEIKDFFDDLSVVGSNQVALSKYTEKVAAYLEDNNALGQYVIMRLGS
jgi:hypothetical protein